MGSAQKTEIGDSGEIEGWLMSAGQTDVTMNLRTSIRPRGLLKLGAPIRIINVTVENPEGFERAVRDRLMS
ncbi:MAG: hypothetical protein HQ477_03445 [Chloroflexi bacterium]|nr:hypothetical protein [Chloroflexota bacterium]